MLVWADKLQKFIVFEAPAQCVPTGALPHKHLALLPLSLVAHTAHFPFSPPPRFNW